MKRAKWEVGCFEQAKNGQFIGVSLGYDLVPQHQRGIGRLKTRFGMVDEFTSKDRLKEYGLEDNPKVLGIARRMIHAVPETLTFTKVENRPTLYLLSLSAFVALQHKCHKKLHKKELDSELTLGQNSIAAAWDDGEFAILVKAEWRDRLEELYQAFLRHDIAIYLDPENAETPILKIMIASRMPEHWKADLWKYDKSMLELREAAKASNIHALLERSGRRWMKLDPVWVIDESEDETEDGAEVKHLEFHLVPFEGDNAREGWYTVEELQLWCEGKGPIPTNAAASA